MSISNPDKPGRRKTAYIRDLIALVNTRNRVSLVPADVRAGWNSLLEAVLHDANVYAGFGFYDASEVPEGQLPGIVRGISDLDVLHNPTLTATPNMFPDESRRFYYFHRSLRAAGEAKARRVVRGADGVERPVRKAASELPNWRS